MMDSDKTKSPTLSRAKRARFGAPRLLIVGCGDVGLRIVARVSQRFRVVALTSSPERKTLIRQAGVLPLLGNLDHRGSLKRLRGLSNAVIHLAPPPNRGRADSRTAHLLQALRFKAKRMVYISTTGVYGDHLGAWIDETTPLKPLTDRAWRRINAEQQMRSAAACVLRVPGIYASDRLPLERLRAGTAALAAKDDVFTNHIHADDLARAAIFALMRGKPGRLYNAVDDTQLKMGDYFDAVAQRFALPQPPRLPRNELAKKLTPMQYSFMVESRRIKNHRLKNELRLRLNMPTVQYALKKMNLDAEANEI